MKKNDGAGQKAKSGVVCETVKRQHREDPSVFSEGDVLTPAMREQMEAFYGKVDADLFASEHEAHMALCRELAEAARKRGEVGKALTIERKAREWARKHRAAFMAELRKEVA